MEVITLSESEDSESSIIELEVPKKPTPPLIEVEEDEITLNVQTENRPCLARDIIRNDLMLANMSPNRRVNGQCENHPSHWTLDMIKFYDDDWGGEEEFVVEKLQEKMCKAPSLWQISRKDYLYSQNKNRKSKVRCSNCQRYGHRISDCSEPPYVLKCFMCGDKGHNYHPCPNSKCLTCGTPTAKYLMKCFKCKSKSNQRCSRCNLLGHHNIDCTDHWRLFHLTTSSLSVIVPNGDIYKSEKDMWCCNCANQGHHQILCAHVKNFEVTATLPFVASYKKSFEYRQQSNLQGSHRKKFKEWRKEQMENLKTNDPPRTLKQNKFNLHRFKKFQRFKKRDRRRGNGFLF